MYNGGRHLKPYNINNIVLTLYNLKSDPCRMPPKKKDEDSKKKDEEPVSF